MTKTIVKMLEETFKKAIQHGASSSLEHPLPTPLSASNVPTNDDDVYVDVPFPTPPSSSHLM
jgi:hypothetical protein